MHILYFHQHFSTPQGATGIRSYHMAQRLVKHGHAVTMICGSYAQARSGLAGPFQNGQRVGFVEGIRVIEFDLAYSNRDTFLKRSATFLRFAWGSLKISLVTNYDILFATSTPLTAGIPGIAARWFRRKPFVFEVRDLWPELPQAMGVITNPLALWALALLEWISYRSANRCVALAPGIAAGIRRQGVPSSAILTIPNGCDISIFGSPGASWRPNGVRTSDLLAVFAGTHGAANGLNAALDAAQVLQQRGRNDIKILFIGDGSLKDALKSRVQKDSLHNVLFLSPVNKDRLAQLFSAADVGLQLLRNVPSFYFGTSPNKFFDYIAAGLPVLTNYPGWVAELIDEGGCGFVVPPEDPGAFADALEEAADDRDLLKAKGRNARALAAEKFARDELAERWVAWITEGQDLNLPQRLGTL